MTTRSQLWWVALLGGAELTVQSYLADRTVGFHAGVWLVAAALLVAAWRAAGASRATLLAAASLPVALSALAALGLPSRAPDPLAAFWQRHAADRKALASPAKGDSVTLFGETVALDEHGFRQQQPGPEGAYRIVALGGSSTFGAPLPEEGPPWPELLEAKIAALGCAVPVTVYNAGRTGRGVARGVRHFRSEIGPLRPDLLLVYPGPLDMIGLAGSLPLAIGAVAPLPPRSSELLRRLEASWRVSGVERRYHEELASDPPAPDPEEVPLAAVYHRLLVESLRRGIAVAIATPSLAVNGSSPEREIRRHEALEPATRHVVLANRVHTALVRRVGTLFRVISIDTRPGLDGGGDADFLDLFHLRRAGRERLASNLADGLRQTLAARPRPGCPPAPEPLRGASR